MAKQWTSVKTNSGRVLSLLSSRGPRSRRELSIDLNLTPEQCKYAIHELTQTDKVELKNGAYQSTASIYARQVISRVWNKSIFEGVTA